MTRALRADSVPSTDTPPEDVLVVHPDSVALRRLIDEVELGEALNLESYNRTYHRHNR